jgi:hypothetical protein
LVQRVDCWRAEPRRRLKPAPRTSIQWPVL